MAILDFYCQVILADQLADLSPRRGIQWQRMAILDFYCQSSYRQINWQVPAQRHLVAKNDDFTFLLLVHIGRSTGRSNPPGEASNGKECQFQISTIRVHIGRSTGRSTPHRCIQQQRLGILDFYCQFILADKQFEISTVSSYWQINWQIYPPIDASTSKDWVFQISTVSSYWQISNLRFLLSVHIGRSTGRSNPPRRGIQWQRMAILDFYCWFILADQLADLTPKQRHLVAKNGDFRFLL